MQLRAQINSFTHYTYPVSKYLVLRRLAMPVVLKREQWIARGKEWMNKDLNESLSSKIPQTSLASAVHECLISRLALALPFFSAQN